MSNEINIIQESSEQYRLTPRGERVKKLATRVLQGTGVAVSGAVLGFVGNEMLAAQEAVPYGVQEVTVEPGDTTHGLIKEHVVGGAEHVGDATEAVEGLNPGVDVGKLPTGLELKLPDGMED